MGLPLGCILTVTFILIAERTNAQRGNPWGPAVNIVTLMRDPLVMQCDEAEENITCDASKQFKGFCVDFLNYFSKRIQGLRYNLSLAEDGEYGRRQPNGSWNGLIGVVAKGKADAAIADIIRTPEREGVVDFSEPFMRSGIGVLMKKPSKRCAFSLLLKPFSLGTWLLVIFGNILFLAIVILLWIFLIPREVITAETKEERRTFCTILAQDLCGRRGSLAIFVTLLVWLIFVIFVVSAYIANLAAILNTERNFSPILSVNDLATQPYVKYGILKDGSTQRFFETTKDPLYTRLWRTMKQDPSSFVSSYEEGVERVRDSDGKYALFMDEPAIDHINNQYPCDTFKIGTALHEIGYHVVLRRGSRYKDFINSVVKEMNSNGELWKLEQKWFRNNPECAESTGDYVKASESLTIFEMGIAVLVFLIGLLIVIIVAVIEFVTSRRKARSVTRL